MSENGNANGTTPSALAASVAYFSMEICLDQAIPTYSGGLGVLAGDTLRSAADLKLPMVGVTLLHRKGYFRQQIDAQGNQTEGPVEWQPEEILEEVAERASVTIEGRQVHVRAWRFSVRGVTGHEVPVLLLDTALPENSEWDRTLTDSLYGGDAHYRLCQEIVLGMGGAQLLRELGFHGNVRYHMNEGHSALLALSLLGWRLDGRKPFEANENDLESVRRQCVFTTHTPVPAGHDRFPTDLVRRDLGVERLQLLEAAKCLDEGELNMTHLALRLSHFVNGVAMKHREVSVSMFPGIPIDAITNGVHAGTWTSPPFQALLDRRIPEWRTDNLYLRYTVGIPLAEIRAAHTEAKGDFIAEVARRTGVQLDPNVFTLGFARRATPYKRADLMFTDTARLADIAEKIGPVAVAPSAATANVTARGNAPSESISATAGTGQVTATANQPSLAVATTAATANVTVSANQATAAVGTAASAGNAQVTVTANAASESITTTAASAQIVAAASSANTAVAPSAAVAQVTVTGQAPTVSAATSAGTAQVTVTAPQASTAVAVTAGTGNVTAAALGATTTTTTAAATANVTVTSNAPSVSVAASTSTASVTVTGNQATVTTVVPGVAIAGTANVTVTATQATTRVGVSTQTAAVTVHAYPARATSVSVRCVTPPAGAVHCTTPSAGTARLTTVTGTTHTVTPPSGVERTVAVPVGTGRGT